MMANSQPHHSKSLQQGQVSSSSSALMMAANLLIAWLTERGNSFEATSSLENVSKITETSTKQAHESNISSVARGNTYG